MEQSQQLGGAYGLQKTAILFAVLLCAGVAFAVIPAAGETTIADCKENDSTAVIDESGLYTLAGDLSGTETCIEITANNVTLDGQGASVTADDISASGIVATGVTNVTVTNLSVSGWGAGISYENSTDSIITDVTATGNDYGIYIEDSEAILVEDTSATENDYGVYAESSLDTVVYRTVATENDDTGVSFYQSSDGAVIESNASANGFAGIYVYDGTENTIIDSVANDNEDDSGLWLEYADENVVVNNTFNGNYWGVALYPDSNNNTLVDNVANDNFYYGFHVYSGSNENVLANNTANRNLEYGGFVIEPDSNDNELVDNTAQDNLWDVYIEDSTGNTVTDLDIGNSTAPETTLSFSAEDIQLRSVDSPPSDPVGYVGIDRYFEAESLSDSAFLNVSLQYESEDIPDDAEASLLDLLRYDGDDWMSVGATVDTEAQVVTANITEFSTVGAFAQGTLSNLDIAGQGTDAVIAPGASENVSVLVTNLGDESESFPVTLTIENGGEQVTETVNTTELAVGENETVVFEAVTDALELGSYDVTVSTGDVALSGSLSVNPDVTGDGQPARDTTGDGLLNDINGDGEFTIADVQALFTNLNTPVVQENYELFRFAGVETERVSVFDVQGLFTQYQQQAT